MRFYILSIFLFQNEMGSINQQEEDCITFLRWNSNFCLALIMKNYFTIVKNFLPWLIDLD